MGDGRGAGTVTTDGSMDADDGTATGVEDGGAGAWPAGAGDKTMRLAGAADGSIAGAETTARAAGGRA